MYAMVQVPKFLKVREAAKEFNVSERTIRNAIHREDIPSYMPNGKTHLIKATDVAAWIETRQYKTRYERNDK